METKGPRLLLPVHIERSTNLPQPIKFKDENLRCTQLAQPYHLSRKTHIAYDNDI